MPFYKGLVSFHGRLPGMTGSQTPLGTKKPQISASATPLMSCFDNTSTSWQRTAEQGPASSPQMKTFAQVCGSCGSRPAAGIRSSVPAALLWSRWKDWTYRGALLARRRPAAPSSKCCQARARTHKHTAAHMHAFTSVGQSEAAEIALKKHKLCASWLVLWGEAGVVVE